MTTKYLPESIISQYTWDFFSEPEWIEEPICDKETTDKVAKALKEAGFEVDTKFKIVSKHSCTIGLSMRSPIEGELSPENDAISRCGEGIGLDSIAIIEGTSNNGMTGKTLSLYNGAILEQWYMARIHNPFGEGTIYIPILANIKMVEFKIRILQIIEAELP
jgi:hypothetical protein